MTSLSTIIDTIGQAKIADRLSIHRRNPSAWKARGSIPAKYWAGIARLCSELAVSDPEKSELAKVDMAYLAELCSTAAEPERADA